MARKAPHQGGPSVEFHLEPAEEGFWIAFRTTHALRFSTEYLAYGTGGYQRRGGLEGELDGGDARLFVRLGFPVVAVGLNALGYELGSAIDVAGPTPGG